MNKIILVDLFFIEGSDLVSPDCYEQEIRRNNNKKQHTNSFIREGKSNSSFSDALFVNSKKGINFQLLITHQQNFI